MDPLQTVALAGGMAWASGIRLYAAVLAAGMLGKFGFLHLPDAMRVLENPWVMGIAGVMLVMELFADKIPVVDSLWDSVHTFIRIPAGAVLAALALGDHDPAWMIAAGLLGGTLAAGTHAAKAGTRAIINTSPEPLSNIVTSTGEDALVAGGLYAAMFHPAVFLVLLALFVIALLWLVPKVFRGLRLIFGGGRLKAARAQSRLS